MENKYFKQEGDASAARLRKELDEGGRLRPAGGARPGAGGVLVEEGLEDVLPEVLKHRLPVSPHQEPHVLRRSSLQSASLTGAEAAAGAQAALQPVGHLPSLRLGPSKYQLPRAVEVVPSTANARRGGRAADKATVEAMMRGIRTVSKAFGVATVLVYGGGIVAFAATCRALGVTAIEDLPSKAEGALQPRIERVRARLQPFRERVLAMAAKWRMTEDEQRSMGSPFAQGLGLQGGRGPGAEGVNSAS